MSEKPGNNDITKVITPENDPDTTKIGRTPRELIRRSRRPDDDQPTLELDPERIRRIDEKVRLEEQGRLRQEVMNLQASLRNQLSDPNQEADQTRRMFYAEANPPNYSDSDRTRQSHSPYQPSDTAELATTSIVTPIPQPLPINNDSGEIFALDQDQDSRDIPITIDDEASQDTPQPFFPPIEIEEPGRPGSMLINLGGISTAGIYTGFPHLYDHDMTAFGSLLQQLPSEQQQLIRYEADSKITDKVLAARAELAEAVDIVRALARMSKQTPDGLIVPESEAYNKYYLPTLRNNFEDFNLVIGRIRTTLARILSEYNDLKPILEQHYASDFNRETVMNTLGALIESLKSYVNLFDPIDHPRPRTKDAPNPESTDPAQYINQLTGFFHLNVILNLGAAQKIMSAAHQKATTYEGVLKSHPNMIPQERHINRLISSQVGNLEAIAEELRTICYHALRILDSMYPEEFRQSIREDQRVLRHIAKEDVRRLSSDRRILEELVSSTKSSSGSVIRRIFGGESESIAQMQQTRLSIQEQENALQKRRYNDQKLTRVRALLSTLMLDLPLIEKLLKG